MSEWDAGRQLLAAAHEDIRALRAEMEGLREELALYRPQATASKPTRFSDL